MKRTKKYDTNQSIRSKIDTRLKKIASINAHTGIDSTEEELDEAINKKLELELEIKEIDSEYYEMVFGIDK